MNLLASIRTAALLIILAACSPPGEPGQGANAPLQDMGSPTDNYGIYSGTVGGRPGFMVIREYPGELATITVSLAQTGNNVSGFSGGGMAAREAHFDFETDWPSGSGQFFEHNRYSGEGRGASRLRGVWDINQRIMGRVVRRGSEDSVLDFDLEFNPLTLSTLPEGNAIPEGRYDILHDGRDVGDYIVETPGSGAGTITWPGAQRACELVPSPALRAMGTTRNVWHIEFNSADVSCAPPTWSIGYAVMTNGDLTFELIASRQGNFAPAPEGEADLMHLQLRQR